MDTRIARINLGFVNCYLAKGKEGFVLFDTGIGSLRGRLEKELAAAGCTRNNLKLVVLTHGDIDHAGNCAYLRREYGAPIAMHRGDLAMVEKGDLGMDRKITSPFMRAMQSLLKLIGLYDTMSAGFETFTPDLFLENGQKLDEYGIEAEAAHIPGHTEGSMAVVFRSRECICGDTLLYGKKGYLVKNEGDLERSVEKLKALDITLMYPGHGKPFRWPKERGSAAQSTAAQR